MEQPTVICVTPIRNEAWILEKFLGCAGLWADHIIVLDQCSDDGSRELACAHPKVTLAEYASPKFDEPERRGRLFEIARRIPGRRLLLAVDADEFLTTNFAESRDWNQMLAASAGTVIRMERLTVMPGAETCWSEGLITCGFMDDGTPFETAAIHGPRVPQPEKLPVMELQNIKILHYQCMDWARMRSKHRWYECWERLNDPKKRPITSYRQYHHMEAVSVDRMQPVAPEWLAGYACQGIEMETVEQEPHYRWDAEVLAMFEAYGTHRFRKLDVWDADWEALSREMGGTAPAGTFRDPRSAFEKGVQSWLKRTQRRSNCAYIRWMQRALIPLGW